MEETHAQETERLIFEKERLRDSLAHATLAAMLDGRHREASELLGQYQLACIAVDAAVTICAWFDDANGSWPEEVIVHQAKEQAPREAENTE